MQKDIKKIFKLNRIPFCIAILIVTVIIISIYNIFPKAKADSETVFGNNNGYGMVKVTYHSNYIAGTAENGEKADEDTYSITTPIYINNKGEYCISFGEYKFTEKQVSSDGISDPNEDENAIDTGFRGYTLTNSPSANIDEKTGFWKSVATGSHGPDNIPDSALKNTKEGVKRIFNDWEDEIYQQGDELILSSSNISNYSKISYLENYDANRSNGTGILGDSRVYTLDVYAQWVKANVVYVASEATEAKANELNTTFGVKNIKASNIRTTVPNAIKAVNKTGDSFYENYIIVTDYSSNGYTIKTTSNTAGNGFTITSKYFGVNTNGRIYASGTNPEILQYEDIRLRNIDIYSTKTGGMGYNEYYTQGNCFIMEYGIRQFLTNGTEITNDVKNNGNFNIDADGYSGPGTSRAAYIKMLSGHAYRILIDRQLNQKYLNKYVYYQLGGTAISDMLLAGPAQGTLQQVTSYMTIKDCAKVVDFYGGNQGFSTAFYIARDCTTYMNVYSNAEVKNGIYGGGGGRSGSVPFFSGEININICGGKVNSVYGAGAASIVVPKTNGDTSKININVLGGRITVIYGAGNGMSPDITQDLTEFSAFNGALNGNVEIKTKNATIGSIYGGGQGYNDNTKAKGCAFRNGDAVITISKGTIIEQNIYGGGKGFDSHPTANISDLSKTIAWQQNNTSTFTYKIDSSITSKTSTIETAEVINGKTIINIENGVTVEGNVYGGGEYASTISEDGSEINITGGTIKGEVFGGGNSATLTGTNINISGGTFTNIYGGGNAADVDNTELHITGGTAENIYGGGKSGNVTDSTNVNISNLTANNVFGGGYEGDVLGNASTTVISGTYKNVFGGGDQGHIGTESEENKGNITLIIGDEKDLGVAVKEIAYGGGKGKIEEGETDASNFPTAYGKATVTIQGIKTKVENYGSKTLGKVVGDVDVIFKNYWTGNSTSKYKTMNGIDRATTVEFDNSYVLLENKNENGELEGIKSIENLIIPQGSGLKISADGEISGDFVGGGELYLDSKVCLTIGKDISGVTKLVLNPKLTENINLIKGGIDNPYMKVAGVAQTEQAVISGEIKYDILEASKEETNTGYIHYYIEKDIEIVTSIDPTSISISGRKYLEEIENDKDVNILNNGIFSTDIKIDFNVATDTSNIDKYKNITREFMLKKDRTTQVALPNGTEILMIVDGKYYSYILTEDKDKIKLSEFKDIEGNNYKEISDFSNAVEVEKSINEITKEATYKLNEDFRFIINFENSKTKIAKGTYYPMINILDLGTWLNEEQTDAAKNTVQIINSREYSFDGSADRETYINKGVINIDGKINVSSALDLDIDENTDLYAKLSIVDSQGKRVDIPNETKISLNDATYKITDGIAYLKFIDNITNNEISRDANIKIDMTDLMEQEKLSNGNYKFVLEFILSQNESMKNVVQAKSEIAFKIENIDVDKYGLKVELINDTDIPGDRIQLIENSKEQQRAIKLNYIKGEIENGKAKIKILEKTGEFEYENITNSSKIKVKSSNQEITEIANLANAQQLQLNFAKGVGKGTYRVVFELYDDYGNKITETYLNFIVIDEIKK